MARRKKEKFWSGAGKFLLVLLVLYLGMLALKKIYNSGSEVVGKYTRTDIQLIGNQMVASEQILQLCGFKQQVDSVTIDLNRLANRLMQEVYIKGVSITRRPPNRLNITLDERKPVAFIYGKGLNLIDREGYLMPIPESNAVWDLPLITGVRGSLGRLSEKTTVSEVYFVLEMLSRLESENVIVLGMISEIDLSAKEFITLYLIKGGVPVRISRATCHKELYILKNWLANHVDWQNLEKFEYIDLRFENQLIVKPQS
jgi:cell division protein FtsQ